MRILLHDRRRQARGYILALTMLFTAIGFTILADILSYTTVNTTNNDRNNQLYDSEMAAEAATEKALSAVMQDYETTGEGLVYSKLSQYVTNYPTTAESSFWSGFSFSDGQGNANKSYVARMGTTNFIMTTNYVPLAAQYSGLMGFVANYRIVANASPANSPYNIKVGIKQDVELATIPAFQFAIFYNMDLEINPGPNMTVTGPVHGNANFYSYPNGGTLTFQNNVAAVGMLNMTNSPLDPSSRSPGTVNFNALHTSHSPTLALPIGTNNSPTAVQAILQQPPAGEATASPMGQLRYYNQADLVVLVTNLVVTTPVYTTNIVTHHVTTNNVTTTNISITATSGLANSFATTVPAADVSKFITTNTFNNAREGANINSIDINIAQLAQWSYTNNSVRPVVTGTGKDGDISIVYVADNRPVAAGTEAGIRVFNGQNLNTNGFSYGLTVATPDPLYVWGNYNVPTSALGTTNTSATKPASFAADAITVLSPAWTDLLSTAAETLRNASATTVNAAFLTGIVPSNGTSYSGGVENFPRFLEDWGGVTFTYNGSMVAMYNSLFATAPWGGANVYTPPTRAWAFDQNFTSSTKLPPGTPQFRAVIRAGWAAVAANNVN